MAFAVPGVRGKPIHANNFTRRFRGNPRIAAWATLTKDAHFDDGSGTLRMVPRKGATLLTNPNGAITEWAPPEEQTDGFEFWRISTASAGTRWDMSGTYANDGPGFGLTAVCRPSEGYVEPMSLRFSNGHVVFPQINHGGQSGPMLRAAGTNIHGNPGRTALTTNALGYVNLSYRYADRRISWQADGRGVESTIAPEGWGDLEALPSFNMVGGWGFSAQAFRGILYDVAIWKDDFLGNEDDISLVSEYVATAYGV